MEIDLETNCPSCSFPLKLDTDNILIIEKILSESGGKSFSVKYVHVPCSRCKKSWFMPFYEFLALFITNPY